MTNLLRKIKFTYQNADLKNKVTQGVDLSDSLMPTAGSNFFSTSTIGTYLCLWRLMSKYRMANIHAKPNIPEKGH